MGVCILASCSSEKQLNATSPLEISVSLQSRFGVELKKGSYEGAINSRDLAEIAEYAKTIGYFDLAPEYDNKKVMDLPASISSIEGHRVFNRFEGPNLDPLYNMIEDKISKVKWYPISEN